MKRLAIGILLVAASTGAVMAAPPPDCPAGFSDPNQETYIPGFVVEAAGSESCKIANALPSADPDRYVVYKVDMRPEFLVEDGVSVIRLTYTAEGVTKVVEFREGDEEYPFISDKYAALDPADGFNGTYTLELVGAGGAYLDQIIVTSSWTTKSDQKKSFDQLGLQQVGLATHIGAMNDLLTGANQPLEGKDEIGVLGGLGSYMVGATGRLNLAPGFSLLGGVSALDLDITGAGASGFSGALALRYVEPSASQMQYFGEIGTQASALNVNLSRSFYDSLTFDDDYDATGSGDALLAGIYIKGGVIIEPAVGNELIVSASLKQSGLFWGSFTEDDPEANPNYFQADLSNTSMSLTTFTTGADWTTQLAPDLELTASGAVGATLSSGAKGTVFGVGEVEGGPQSTIFAQYGLRLGWMPTDDTRIEGYVQGTTGTGIGTHAQIGAAYKLQF